MEDDVIASAGHPFHLLEAYIPGDRRRALAGGTRIPDRVQGAGLFADISGFTALTEALVNELGPQRGAEELTVSLNRVFQDLIAHLERFGGHVIYFSGDAITCWLDGDDGARATACALAMQKAMGEAQLHEICLSADDAKSPKEEFFTGADKNCRYEHFNWGDGKIDLKLNCNHPNARQQMLLVGTYDPDSYTMSMTASTEGDAPVEQMVMKMRVDAKRIGDCDKGEEAGASN